jgi:hypothetical protein
MQRCLRILLTEGTGVVGQALLHKLASWTSAPVWVLVHRSEPLAISGGF